MRCCGEGVVIYVCMGGELILEEQRQLFVHHGSVQAHILYDRHTYNTHHKVCTYVRTYTLTHIHMDVYYVNNCWNVHTLFSYVHTTYVHI